MIDILAYSKLNNTHKYQLSTFTSFSSCKYICLSTNKYFGLDSLKHLMHHIKLDKFHWLKQGSSFFKSVNCLKRKTSFDTDF